MDKELKQMYVFGYGMGVLLTVFGTISLVKRGWNPVPPILYTAAVVFVVISVINIQTLKPLFKVWMKGAHAIGTVINFVILTLVYYVVFGMIGIVLRLMKKDFLDRHLDPDAGTYWIKCPEKKFNPRRYHKQF